MAASNGVGQFGLARVSESEPRQSREAVEYGSTPAPIPNVFNGAVFESVNVPSSAQEEASLSIFGEVGFDCPLCVVDRQIRVVAEISDQEDRIDEVGGLNGRGETGTFNFSIPAPEAGETMTVRLKAQRKPPQPTAGWVTDNTEGPFDVNVLTQGEKITQDAIGFAPWAVGGAAVGYGAASLTDNSQVGGGVAGAGVGVAAKVAFSGQQGGFVPDIPFRTIIVGAALLGGIAVVTGRYRPDLSGVRARAMNVLPIDSRTSG